jgi:hypothetical protein
MKFFGVIFATAVIFYGCASSASSIHVVDGLSREVFLTFSKGTDVRVHDVFVVYHVQVSPRSATGGGGHAGHGGGGAVNLRHTIGRVQVIELVDERHALVKVLSGQVEEGALAEKED